VTKELYAVLVKTSTFGPIATFVPYSTVSANTYPLPPPTTLVGALAYAYLRSRNNFRELAGDGASLASELIKSRTVLYAVAGVDEPFTIIQTTERVYQHIYLRAEHRKRIDMAYTVGVRSGTILKNLYMFFITYDSELAKYCYAITRVGRKESLVAVENVEITPLSRAITESRYCETYFYFPLSIAEEYGPPDMWIQIDMPTLVQENFAKRGVVTEKFVVPKPFTLTRATVRLNESGVVLKVRSGDKVFEIPVPRSIVEAGR
jgi:CRISPR-associated protein Cas5 subtype I-A